jgi:hypothetical protein
MAGFFGLSKIVFFDRGSTGVPGCELMARAPSKQFRRFDATGINRKKQKFRAHSFAT